MQRSLRVNTADTVGKSTTSVAPRATTGGLGNQARLRRLAASQETEEQAPQDVWDDLLFLKIIAHRDAAPGSYKNDDCPSRFCQPFADKAQAEKDFSWALPKLLPIILDKVGDAGWPLWRQYLSGGGPSTDRSAELADAFSYSYTTGETTDFLLNAVLKEVTEHGEAILGKKERARVNFDKRLAGSLKSINDAKDPRHMNFHYSSDITAFIAGGIGDDQGEHAIGKTPSTTPDARKATVEVLLERTEDGGISFTPSIEYTVTDTVDLCPGNCGTWLEEFATVPLSRFEATGMIGDAPYVVHFPAPEEWLPTYTVRPTDGPAPGGQKRSGGGDD